MLVFFAQTAKIAVVATKAVSVMTGAQVALWTMGAITAMIMAYKLVEWLLGVAGLSKSPQDKLLEALEDDRRMLRTLHSILTDKVFAKEQEGRFDDIARIKEEIERVFKWMKTPPDIETPAFWCRSPEHNPALARIKAMLEELIKHEGEREKQTELIIKLLQALAARRNGGE